MQSAFTLAENIKPRLANDFQRKLLAASLQSAQDVLNPLRLNNFSTSFRELTRHVFLELAPDNLVALAPWFVPDLTNKGRPTRAQKVSYVVHGGLDPTYVEDELGLDIAAERKALLEVIDQFSKFTHVNEDSFDCSPEEVEYHVYAACKALQSFLDCSDDARTRLCDEVEEKIHYEVVSEAISETILSLDEIAAHHYIDEVYVHQIEVVSLNHEEIRFIAHGSIKVQLQWGSNSDVRRGDDTVILDFFPLICNLVSPALVN